MNNIHPGQNETLVMNCPHCKVWQAPHTLDEEVISLLMQLRTHWNLWRSPMFIQQSNKPVCYPHFTAADPCWYPMPIPLALWTQLGNCPCPLPHSSYLPSLSSTSMHSTTEVKSMASVSWHGYDQANMSVDSWRMSLKIALQISQVNNWGSLAEWTTKAVTFACFLNWKPSSSSAHLPLCILSIHTLHHLPPPTLTLTLTHIQKGWIWLASLICSILCPKMEVRVASDFWIIMHRMIEVMEKLRTSVS